MMTAYKPGSGTIKAIKSLAEKLDLSMDRSMHKWSIELAERNQLREVIFFYDSLTIADEKFVLMEILVQVANDQDESKPSWLRQPSQSGPMLGFCGKCASSLVSSSGSYHKRDRPQHGNIRYCS